MLAPESGSVRIPNTGLDPFCAIHEVPDPQPGFTKEKNRNLQALLSQLSLQNVF
jgi:hypothetical protein